MKTKQEQIEELKSRIEQVEWKYNNDYASYKEHGYNMDWVFRRKNIEIYHLKKRIKELEKAE
jgi:hypothetical protein